MRNRLWIYIIRIIFFAIFVLNIIGALYFYSESGTHETLDVVVLGLIGFLIGLFLGEKLIFRRRRLSYTPTIKEIRSNHKLQSKAYFVIVVLFAVSLLFAITLFLQKGIPLFSPNDTQMRSTFGVGTAGRIRALVTWCPVAGLMMFCLFQINKRYRRPAMVIIGLAFLVLAFYSFKGNLVWFAMMLYLVNTVFKKKIQFGQGIIYAGIAFITLMLVFSIWLSVEYSVAYDSLIKRITQDQVDGLNYIITRYVPSSGFKYGEHFWTQLTGTMFSVYEESFDIKLARLFYGRNVTWGIVQTLYGFLYFDFGRIGVVIGFIILGMLVRGIEDVLIDVDNQTIPSITFTIYLVYVLIKIFLVGNVFNEIKGLLLSEIVFNILYVLLYTIMFTGWKLKRKAIKRKSITSTIRR